MSLGDVSLFLVHVAACLVAVLGVAWLGRTVARWFRQPEVIGEITGGLLAGPLLHAVAGPGLFGVLLSGSVLDALKRLGEAGLALFLVGLTHELRTGQHGLSRRALSWITLGALVPSLLAGTLLAGWVLLADDPALRGPAPLPAFVLFVAVALSITAVPVLARIMSDRGLTGTTAGRLALTGAIVLDSAGWLLLSIVVCLNSGDFADSVWTMLIMAGAAVAALLLGRLLRIGSVPVLVTGFPRMAAVVVGAGAVAAALTAEHLGLSMVLGAVLFGLAIPAGDSPAWARVSAPVTRVGRSLVPVFFVVTGVTVFTTGYGSAPWELLLLTVVLGIAGKIGGGYLGARLAGETRWTAARVGVLINTRGLTELIVLQVGYSTGIVTRPLFLALVVMALVTTALTGPLLSLQDWAHRAFREATPTIDEVPGETSCRQDTSVPRMKGYR